MTSPPPEPSLDHRLKSKQTEPMSTQQNQSEPATNGDVATDAAEEKRLAELYQAAKDENELLEFKNYELLFKIQELEQRQRKIMSKLVAGGCERCNSDEDDSDYAGGCESTPEEAFSLGGAIASHSSSASTGMQLQSEGHEDNHRHYNNNNGNKCNHYRKQNSQPFSAAWQRPPTTNSADVAASLGADLVKKSHHQQHRRPPLIVDGKHNAQLIDWPTAATTSTRQQRERKRSLQQPADEKVGSELGGGAVPQVADHPTARSSRASNPSKRQPPVAAAAEFGATTTTTTTDLEGNHLEHARQAIPTVGQQQQHLVGASSEEAAKTNKESTRLSGLHDAADMDCGHSPASVGSAGTESALGETTSGIMRSAPTMQPQSPELLHYDSASSTNNPELARKLASRQLIEYNASQRAAPAAVVAVGEQQAGRALISAAASCALIIRPQAQPEPPPESRIQSSRQQQQQLQLQALNDSAFGGSAGLLGLTSQREQKAAKVTTADRSSARATATHSCGSFGQTHPSESALTTGSQLRRLGRPRSLMAWPPSAATTSSFELGEPSGEQQPRESFGRQSQQEPASMSSQQQARPTSRTIDQEAKKLARSQPNLCSPPTTPTTLAPQAAARRSAGGGARIAVPVTRRPVPSGAHSNGGRPEPSANYLRARSKSSLDQSSGRSRAATGLAASTAGPARRPTVATAAASANNKPQQNGNRQASSQAVASKATAAAASARQQVAPISAQSAPSSAKQWACLQAVQSQMQARAAPLGAGGELAIGAPATTALTSAQSGLAPQAQVARERSRGRSSSCGFVTQIPTLISQSHAGGGGGSHLAPTGLAAPIGDDSSPPAAAHQQQAGQSKPSGSQQAPLRPALRASSKSMSNLATFVLGRAEVEAKTAADANEVHAHHYNDELRGEDLASAPAPGESDNNKAVFGSHSSLLPKAAPARADSGSWSCVSFVGREEWPSSAVAALPSHGQPTERDSQQQQKNASKNSEDGALGQQCAQCKLFQSKVGLLIRDRKLLNEQLSELEELENDLRLTAQRLAQQLAASERQLEACKLELQRAGETQSQLQSQNKRLSLELNERLEAVEQLQCQLARLQQTKHQEQKQQQQAAAAGGSERSTASIVGNNSAQTASLDAADNNAGEQRGTNSAMIHSTRNETDRALSKRINPTLSTMKTSQSSVDGLDEQQEAAMAKLRLRAASAGSHAAATPAAAASLSSTSSRPAGSSGNNNSGSSDDDSAIDLPDSAKDDEESSSSTTSSAIAANGEQEVQKPAHHHQQQYHSGQQTAGNNASNGGKDDNNTTMSSSAVVVELKGEDSAYSKSSSSSSSDDGNRSDSDLHVCADSDQQQQQQVGESAGSAAGNPIGPILRAVSSSSSGDESDHHESSAAVNLAATPSASAGAINNSTEQTTGGGGVLASRQQVLRKKISTARILRGIQVHCQQSPAALSPAASNSGAAVHPSRQTTCKQACHLQADTSSSPGEAGSKSLVGQARLAQVVPAGSAADINKQQATTMGLPEPAETGCARQRLSSSSAKSKSFIDLALEGVEELERGQCTDEALNSLMFNVHDSTTLGKSPRIGAARLNSLIGGSEAKSRQQPIASTVKPAAQQEAASAANFMLIIEQHEQEIVSLRMRLMQAQTLNDNLVSELRSSKQDRACSSSKGSQVDQQQQQQQQFYSRTSTFVNNRQQQTQSQRNSMIIEQVGVPGAVNENSPALAAAAEATLGATGQRSIVYVNGLRASVSHQQTTHITATSCSAGNELCSGNANNSIGPHNYYQHRQHSATAATIGLEETVDFLRFLLNKVHFHHGRTFELVNECQKLAMNALLASYSHQLDLAHHNQIISAGNEASQRAAAAATCTMQPAPDLYPVRPPPRRRSNSAHHHQQQQQNANQQRPIASGSSELEQQATSGNRPAANEQKAINVSNGNNNTEDQRSQPATTATSALKVAKQTLFSIVPIYYNNSINKEKSSSSASSANLNGGNSFTAAADSSRAAAIIKRSAKTKSLIVLNQSVQTNQTINNNFTGVQLTVANDQLKQQHQQNVSVLEINRNGSTDYHRQPSNVSVDSTSNNNLNLDQHQHQYNQQQHLVNVKHSLSEDIERYRVHFNGQLLDLLTRQNWCESIIMEKLKTYQTINADWTTTTRQRHQDKARSTFAQSESCIHMMESSNGAKAVNSKSANVPTNNINFNPNGLVTQQRQSWTASQGSTASLC